MSAARNRELANDLARRSAEKHERMQAEADAKAAAEAEAQTRADDGHQEFNAELRRGADSRSRRAALAERIFLTAPDPEPSTGKPQGDADAGKGEPDDAEYETVWTDAGPQKMRVFPLD